MKAMNSGTSNRNSNWLGFSLSSHMAMEVSTEPHHDDPRHHQDSSSLSNPCSTFFNLPPPHPNLVAGVNGVAGGVYGGAGDEGIYPRLSVIPLKSDGSLCIMEALRRSQQEGMVASSSPKLEDFLGPASMAAGTHHHHHQYGSVDGRDEAIQSSNASSFDLLLHQPPFRQHMELQQHHHHHHQYFHPLQDHEIYNPSAPLEEEMAGDGMPPGLKNWVAGHFAGAMGYGGDLRCLSLSMCPASHPSCLLAPPLPPPPPTQISIAAGECAALDATKKRAAGKVDGPNKQPVHRKSIDTFGQRTSQYRGVTRHRWTGRYEAHLWDNSCKKEGQTRKGRQVYLGGYDMEEKAARAYDLAALKYWGPSTHTNFPSEGYHQEIEEMQHMTRQEYVAHLRRKSSGFSRGASIYRGVTRHHQHGRWQARIGRVAGNKDLYLGTFSTQEDAAEAYDIAAIKFRGLNAVTNFDISRYNVEKIMESDMLLAGELARRCPAITANGDDNGNPGNLSSAHNGDVADESCGVGSDWKMVLHHLGTVADSPGFEESGNNGIPGTLSSASSMVSSLNNSREGSPDRIGNAMVQAKPQDVFIGAGLASSWLPPTTQMRQAIPLAHMPVFAAWTDA